MPASNSNSGIITSDFTSEELTVMYNACILAFVSMDRDSGSFAKDIAIVMSKLEKLLNVENSFLDGKRWNRWA